MLIKKGSLLTGIFFCCCFFMSCRQQADNTVNEDIPRRIPVSVKDSILLSIDKSPMDMIYFPENYPAQKMTDPALANPVARVIYSRPQKKGRPLFTDSSAAVNAIQRYGHEWRLGANEATEIEFFKPVTINGKVIAPGRYIMYCIPYPDTWKIILNTNLYSWGLHIDKTKTWLKWMSRSLKNDIEIEYFTMLFQNSTYGCDLVMAWGDTKVVLPVNFQ
ncbi:MAG: DUF2911 domain-containing protein [Chitinophagaceae bacterium]|nr:DUF2911 domain-containing protein [Chitinophagaceae bacterium]